MIRSRSTRNATLAFGLSIMSACSYRPASNITCEKIRALQIGTTIDEVRSSLGTPLSEGSTASETDRGDTLLDYSMPPTRKVIAETRAAFGGVRLFIYFSRGRLRSVQSYQRYPWSDSQSIYFLDDKGRFESTLFKTTYCP